MIALQKGRYRARMAANAADLAAAQCLRHLVFVEGAGGRAFPDKHESDAFDDLCQHVLVEDIRTARLVCCYRLLPLGDGRELSRSYASQYYDLSALEKFPGRMVEMGRFCIHPDCCDPDILRVAWGAMTQYVDASGAELLFGCASFRGTEPRGYLDAFAMLKARHLAPSRWLPQVKAPDVFRYARRLRRKPNARRAMLTMPPLLRTYLIMGGWVSDHAVVDRAMNTLHVFTGLEIAAIPPARAKVLRAVSV